jgi:hypothetical protein
MAYDGIKTSTQRIAPRRAPPRLPEAPPKQESPAPQATPSESHDFEPVYRTSSILSTNAAEPVAAALDPGLERLVEIAAAELGCPHEELLRLKDYARVHPAEAASFCQNIFETRVMPRREKPDPLMEPREGSPCVFWIETIHGRSTVQAPMNPGIHAYAGQKLELYAVENTPFAKLFAKKKAAGTVKPPPADS